MKDIKGYEGLYAITSCGKVWSYRKQRFLAPGYICLKGYPVVTLCRNGAREQHYIHRLVAEAYLPNPEGLPEVNHKDENPKNPWVNNLEWCTHRYNTTYSIAQKIVCLDTGKEYESITALCEEMGFDRDKFRDWIRDDHSHKSTLFQGHAFEFIGRRAPLKKKRSSNLRRLKRS